ncbi:hypothetical protein COCMIDRAFT_92888 [Bipolaris oryzae ATCC 44560]|uniref:Uncharacterized protein n=1 Tax=Bipolaris oryzae ATCC 44560 TaxID=930090 RepID=W6Z3T7_COCMI|nr:uncharacterized protein COCMIDRAFT_92888 [Bipolaris oryzae ATCC 44560]EUC46412.1 hypothetical protein COCMIDRAFT_92888 [Bipolaris oryzae ATCC 44560]
MKDDESRELQEIFSISGACYNCIVIIPTTSRFTTFAKSGGPRTNAQVLADETLKPQAMAYVSDARSTTVCQANAQPPATSPRLHHQRSSTGSPHRTYTAPIHILNKPNIPPFLLSLVARIKCST